MWTVHFAIRWRYRWSKEKEEWILMIINEDYLYPLDVFCGDIWINKGWSSDKSLLSLEEEDGGGGFDCLIRANGGVGILSSGFACRGGMGGGRGRFVEFFFSSLSIEWKKTRK